MFQILLIIIYFAFISLGLPDSLLGAAWPSIYPDFNISISYAGIVSMIISLGTIISSLFSDKLTGRFGTGKITLFSVAATAVALFGFSISRNFISLCFWAIPYGLGAGSVDASLNNYVALHYKSRHMSWLHCMWGVGATAGPYIMGYALISHKSWNLGYRYVGIIQLILTAILFFSLPLWQRNNSNGEIYPGANSESNAELNKHSKTRSDVLPLREVIKIPGAKEVMLCFFSYCALEATTGLWASSYLTISKGVSADQAAGFAGMFFIGITVGRALSGFLTLKFSDDQLISIGQSLIGIGIVIVLVAPYNVVSLIGLIVIGLGCAPIYPSIIHSTPARFGADKSQALIGIQMASAYIGSLLMPPAFGLIAKHINVAWLPVYLLLILALMFKMHLSLKRKTSL